MRNDWITFLGAMACGAMAYGIFHLVLRWWPSMKQIMDKWKERHRERRRQARNWAAYKKSKSQRSPDVTPRLPPRRHLPHRPLPPTPKEDLPFETPPPSYPSYSPRMQQPITLRTIYSQEYETQCGKRKQPTTIKSPKRNKDTSDRRGQADGGATGRIEHIDVHYDPGEGTSRGPGMMGWDLSPRAAWRERLTDSPGATQRNEKNTTTPPGIMPLGGIDFSNYCSNEEDTIDAILFSQFSLEDSVMLREVDENFIDMIAHEEQIAINEELDDEGFQLPFSQHSTTTLEPQSADSFSKPDESQWRYPPVERDGEDDSNHDSDTSSTSVNTVSEPKRGRGRPPGSKGKRGRSKSDIGRKSRRAKSCEKYNRTHMEEIRTSMRSRREQEREQAGPPQPPQPKKRYRPGEKHHLYHAAAKVDHAFFDENDDPFNVHVQHDAGKLEKPCPHCNALLLPSEKTSLCCADGKVKQTPLPEPPPPLDDLYKGQHIKSKEFLRHSRLYNQSLCMASLMVDQQILPPHGIANFKVRGRMAHRIADYLVDPRPGERKRFLQMYFPGEGEDEINLRMNEVAGQPVDQGLLLELQDMLHENNEYVRTFKSIVELDNTEDTKVVIHHSKYRPDDAHRRSYNRATVREAAIIFTEGDQPLHKQDMVLHLRRPEDDGRRIKLIPSTSRAYDPLFYTLLFPLGTGGFDLCMNDPEEGENKCTFLKFYRFHLHMRQGHSNYVLHARMLGQQWVVEVHVRYQKSVLDWCRFNQKQLRAEKYQVVQDAVAHNAGGQDHVDPGEIGKTIILPPTITGSPRWYRALYFDAMSIVRRLGPPSLFITFTANPAWPEITSHLQYGESAWDRPDIVARVFNAKMQELMKDLLERQVLGKVISHFSVIEFQKRGLPHSHTLLILEEEDKPTSAERIDRIISAELPNSTTCPRLFQLVKKHMIHGPCRSDLRRLPPCMEGQGPDPVCTKYFPKPFEKVTVQDANRFPRYRRRSPEDGGAAFVDDLQGLPMQITSEWVVPFNGALLLKYASHLNVEACHCLEAVKYLYKYLTKGPDRVVFSEGPARRGDAAQPIDEITQYEDARYVSASEAHWRTFGFNIQSKYPPVSTLPVHAPAEHSVLFSNQEEMEAAAHRGAEGEVTKLTAYFSFLSKEGEWAEDIKYVNITEYCTWETAADKRGWHKRKRGVKDDKERHTMLHVGRLPYFRPTGASRELFFIRLLLLNRPANSFEDLRTVDGQLQPTFYEACVQLGLLNDDKELDNVMLECAHFHPGYVVRQMFAALLMHCNVSSPLDMFQKHLFAMAEDIARKRGEVLDPDREPSPYVLNETLAEIEDILQRNGKELRFFQLPAVNANFVISREPPLIRDEKQHDHALLLQQVTEMTANLTEEQRAVYGAVMERVEGGQGPNVFVLSAIGGSGKTYVLNLLLRKVRLGGGVALATAFSGIAATLLDKGRTLHARYKLPVPCTAESSCDISHQSQLANLIRMAKLLIVDEITMCDKVILECVSKACRDIMKNSEPFGGIPTLMGGDFRQILPISSEHATEKRPLICKMTIKRSLEIWPVAVKLKMTVNMRARLAGGETEEHANFLKQLGDGRLPTLGDTRRFGLFRVRIPDRYVLQSDRLGDLLDFVFEGMFDLAEDGKENYLHPTWLASRAVLVPTNAKVDEVNDIMLKRFAQRDEEREYLSSNELLTEDEELNYPVEVLEDIRRKELPAHKLRLRVNSPIMLTRNLDAAAGHCNGARYIVERLGHKTITARHAATGRIYVIPRIDFYTDQATFSIFFRRRQFPVRLAYAVTTNKSQGQTLQKAGLWLPSPLFTHGQLYVAMSRVGHPSNIKVLVHNGKIDGEEGTFTDNVVYHEVLDEADVEDDLLNLSLAETDFDASD